MSSPGAGTCGGCLNIISRDMKSSSISFGISTRAHEDDSLFRPVGN